VQDAVFVAAFAREPAHALSGEHASSVGTVKPDAEPRPSEALLVRLLTPYR
jgi:hypothetical protein